MNPKDLDVNVHPTKKEVGFENQDEISEAIAELLEKHLAEQNNSINFGNPDSKSDEKLNRRISFGKSKVKTKTESKKSKSKEEEKGQMDIEMDSDYESIEEQDLEDVINDEENISKNRGEVVDLQIPKKSKKKEQRKTVRIDHRDTNLDHFLMHGKLDADIHKISAPGKEYGINNPVNYTEKGSNSQEEFINTPNNVMKMNTVIS